MKFSDFKRKTLMEIGEWSNGGKLVSAIDNKDYTLSITDFTNEEMTQIVTSTKSKNLETNIIQNNPINVLGQKWESFTFEGTEKTFDAEKARAYSFMIGGSGDIYIDEYIDPAWVIKHTINHSHNQGDGYVLYKGNITKDNASNPVRIRFNGVFDYNYKWVALFNEYKEFPVSYESDVEYSLPDNLYLLTNVSLTEGDGIYTEYPKKMYQIEGKKLYLPYEQNGEFKVKYSAYPTLLTYDQDNENIADDEELDILDEYIVSLINGVGGRLKSNVDKKYAVGDRYSAISIDNTNASLQNKQKRVVISPIRKR